MSSSFKSSFAKPLARISLSKSVALSMSQASTGTPSKCRPKRFAKKSWTHTTSREK